MGQPEDSGRNRYPGGWNQHAPSDGDGADYSSAHMHIRLYQSSNGRAASIKSGGVDGLDGGDLRALRETVEWLTEREMR